MLYHYPMYKCKRSVSQTDIAKLAGVSKSTVSRVLSMRWKASDNTTKKIKFLAKKLNYIPNKSLSAMMSSFRTQRGIDKNFETIAFINTKSQRDVSGFYSAITKYVAQAKKSAKRKGYAVCEIWLGEKNLTTVGLERILNARGIRGGIVYGHYYKDSIPADFLKVLKKFSFVSMGVLSPQNFRMSVFMDRFLIIRGYIKRIKKMGFSRVGFVIEKFADSYENGKFTGGFLNAQLGGRNIIMPLFWGRDKKRNIANLKKYILTNRLEALFSYSTDISEQLLSLRLNDSIKIFHYDERFYSHSLTHISNQCDVGSATIDALEEMLITSSVGNRISKPKEMTIIPIW